MLGKARIIRGPNLNVEFPSPLILHFNRCQGRVELAGFQISFATQWVVLTTKTRPGVGRADYCPQASSGRLSFQPTRNCFMILYSKRRPANGILLFTSILILTIFFGKISIFVTVCYYLDSGIIRYIGYHLMARWKCG